MTIETKRKIIYIAIGVFLASWLIAGWNYFFPTTNYDIAREEFSAIKDYLIDTQERQENVVEVYQLPNRKVIINTYSKNEADMAEQFSFNPNTTIDKSNVSVTWNKEEDDSVGFFVQIKIEKDGRIYFNREVTFMEQGLEAIRGLLNNMTTSSKE